MNQPSPFQNDMTPEETYGASFERAPLTPSKDFYERRKDIEQLLAQAVRLAPDVTAVDGPLPVKSERYIDQFEFSDIAAARSFAETCEFMTALRKQSAELGKISTSYDDQSYFEDKTAA